MRWIIDRLLGSYIDRRIERALKDRSVRVNVRCGVNDDGKLRAIVHQVVRDYDRVAEARFR